MPTLAQECPPRREEDGGGVQVHFLVKKTEKEGLKSVEKGGALFSFISPTNGGYFFSHSAPSPLPLSRCGTGAMCVRPIDFVVACLNGQFRILQRPSSTHEPSDPLPRVVFCFSHIFPAFLPGGEVDERRKSWFLLTNDQTTLTY